MPETFYDIGMAFPGAAGENLRLGMLSAGFSVCYLSDAEKGALSTQSALMENRVSKRDIAAVSDAAALAKLLKTPRIVFVGSKKFAENPQLISQVASSLEGADVIIDCSCQNAVDSQRRFELFKALPCRYAAVNFSKEPQGSKKSGISAFFGGSRGTWEACREVFDRLKDAGILSECGRIGDGASGVFANSLSDALETVEAQIICEAFDLLKNACLLDTQNAAEVLEEWSEKLGSSMLSYAAKAAKFRSPDGGILLDRIKDSPPRKSAGLTALLESLRESMPFDTLSAALFASGAASLKGRRDRFSTAYPERDSSSRICPPPEREDIRKALSAACAIALSQCFSVIRSSSARHAWGVNYAKCAQLWNSTYALKSALMESACKAYSENSDLEAPLLDGEISLGFAVDLCGLRHTVAYGASYGFALPCMSAALSAFDSARRKNSPANLLAALGDFLNRSGFERTDAPRGEIFHSSFDPPKQGAEGRQHK